jgi:acyl carrier protein
MDDVQNRLINCFSVVFPGIPTDEICQSTQLTMAKWDSIAVITLANVIEEEFGFPVDFDRLPEFDSYQRILAYVLEELQGLTCDPAQ